MRLRHVLCVLSLVVATSPWTIALVLAQSTSAASSGTRETGYAVKKPVFGGGCRTCPWGAIGEIVKTAMEGSGWDIQLCYNCAGGPEQARGVADARMPKPVAAPNALSPAPPNGPEDFGAT